MKPGAIDVSVGQAQVIIIMSVKPDVEAFCLLEPCSVLRLGIAYSCTVRVITSNG